MTEVESIVSGDRSGEQTVLSENPPEAGPAAAASRVAHSPAAGGVDVEVRNRKNPNASLTVSPRNSPPASIPVQARAQHNPRLVKCARMRPANRK